MGPTGLDWHPWEPHRVNLFFCQRDGPCRTPSKARARIAGGVGLCRRLLHHLGPLHAARNRRKDVSWACLGSRAPRKKGDKPPDDMGNLRTKRSKVPEKRKEHRGNKQTKKQTTDTAMCPPGFVFLLCLFSLTRRTVNMAQPRPPQVWLASMPRRLLGQPQSPRVCFGRVVFWVGFLGKPKEHRCHVGGSESDVLTRHPAFPCMALHA